jgi:hypothetical protein
MDNGELIQLADDNNALNAKVREAMAVLEEVSDDTILVNPTDVFRSIQYSKRAD